MFVKKLYFSAVLTIIIVVSAVLVANFYILAWIASTDNPPGGFTSSGTGGKWSDGVESDEIIYSTGNVGIGTNDPDELFHVAGDRMIIENGPSDGSAEIEFRDVDDTNWRIFTNSNDSLAFLPEDGGVFDMADIIMELKYLPEGAGPAVYDSYIDMHIDSLNIYDGSAEVTLNSSDASETTSWEISGWFNASDDNYDNFGIRSQGSTDPNYPNPEIPRLVINAHNGYMGLNRWRVHNAYPFTVGTTDTGWCTNCGNGAYVTQAGVWTDGPSFSWLKQDRVPVSDEDALEILTNTTIEKFRIISEVEEYGEKADTKIGIILDEAHPILSSKNPETGEIDGYSPVGISAVAFKGVQMNNNEIKELKKQINELKEMLCQIDPSLSICQ